MRIHNTCKHGAKLAYLNLSYEDTLGLVIISDTGEKLRWKLGRIKQLRYVQYVYIWEEGKRKIEKLE